MKYFSTLRYFYEILLLNEFNDEPPFKCGAHFSAADVFQETKCKRVGPANLLEEMKRVRTVCKNLKAQLMSRLSLK